MQDPAERDSVAIVIDAQDDRRFSLRMMCLTFLGTGYLPKAPGTWGSLAALFFGLSCESVVLQLPGAGPAYCAAVLAFLILCGGTAVVFLLRFSPPGWPQDPSFVVLDEAVGIWLLMLLLHMAGYSGADIALCAAFLAFRVLDVWKPYPISWLDERVGAFYVLADDLAAGGLAAIIVIVVLSL